MKPRFKKHICESESNCQTCRDYINKLDEYRQSIIGGDVISKKLLRLSGTSNSNKDGEGKRKFDLPKPRLIQTKNMS